MLALRLFRTQEIVGSIPAGDFVLVDKMTALYPSGSRWLPLKQFMWVRFPPGQFQNNDVWLVVVKPKE